MKKPRKEPAEKAGKTLSASEEYRALIENINDILLTLDIQGNITYISPVVERLSNYKVSDLIEKPFTQLIYPDDLPALLDRFTRLLSGHLEPWEFRVVDKDGQIIFVRTSSRPLYKDGEVVGITTLLTDISEHKKIEEKLRESESRYRDLVDNSKNGVAVYEPLTDGEDFIFKDFNHAAEMIDKIKREDIIGKSLLKTFPGIKEFGLFEVLQRVLRTGVPEHSPITWYHDERISGWRDNYVYRLPSGEIVVIYEDVTARKQADESLRKSEELFRVVQEISPDGFTILHPVRNEKGEIIDFSWVYENKTIARINGTDPEEVKGKRMLDLFPTHKDTSIFEAYIYVSNSGMPQIIEEVYVGEIVSRPTWLRLVVVSIGEDIAILAQDITGRKWAESAVYQNEVRFRELFNYMKSGVCIYEAIDNGEDFVFKDFNPAAEMIEKVSKEEVLGKRVSEVFPGVTTFGIFEVFQRVWRTGDPEYFPEHIYKDDKNPGSWRDSWIFKLPNGEIVAVYNDVSERKLAEEKLTKSYESLQKTLNDAISTMVKIVEMRDPYTSGHQIKVADLAVAIAREMKLDDIRIDQLRMSAVIHDVGKMYIPSDILAKPGKLANIELDLIKTHSQGGYDIVKGMDLPCSVANTVLQHHERLDGSGYPYQLKGENTLLEAKILAVADVVEAMSSHRPYRPALGLSKALEEITKNRAKLYDPEVVDTCLELFNSRRFEFKSV